MDPSVWPQYVVEPQYIEGYVKGRRIVSSDSIVSGQTIPACPSSLLRFHCPLCRLIGMGISGGSKDSGKEEVSQPRSLSLKNRPHHRHRCEVKTIPTGETCRPASVCISPYRFSLNPICPAYSSRGSSWRWLYKR